MRSIAAAIILTIVTVLQASAQPYPSPTFDTLTLQTPLAPSSGGTGNAIGILVASNAALQALAVPTAGTEVFRQGSYAPGDGGAAYYVYSVATCSLNSGAGDGGSQIRPTSGNGCWIADFSTGAPTPLVWGAVGNGTTDDTTPVQAALTAMVGKTLFLGPALYKVAGLTTGTITLRGERSAGGIYIRTCTTGLKASTTTETMITIGGDNSLIENVCIQMGATVGAQTAGAAIVVGANADVVLRGGQINYPFIGIDVSGVGTAQNNRGHILDYVITDPSTGGSGIRIGQNSMGEATVDLEIGGTIVDCVDFTSGNPRSGTIGINFIDSGGAFVHDNDPYGCGIGTQLKPLASGQYVNNSFFSNTVLGDTSYTNDLYVDTGSASSGVGLGSVFQGTWTASAVHGPSVLIQNVAGGSVTGIHFVGHRFFPSANNIALDIGQGTDVTVASSMICTNGGTSGNLVEVGGSVQLASFQDNEIGQCDGLPSSGVSGGIAVTSSGVGSLRIQNNTFSGVTSPISWTTSGTTIANIGGNVGVDSLVPSVSSATSVTLPFSKTVTISGTATISTMSTMWSGREVMIIPSGNLPFTTGGNVCNALTAVANVPVLAVWGGTCWNLK